MSEPGIAKEPGANQAEKLESEKPKAERKKTASMKPENGAGSIKTSGNTLQLLQKQISQISKTTQETNKQLESISKIQSRIVQLENKVSQIDKTTQETIDIVRRIKIKKKKGKDKKK